ncbi:hypothetical protein [Chromobacterium violaceum]|uniref:hypothetical protein n=1 Tax=Chromobacterium violaceum TaxID=536 RepID=UPI0009D936A2|nr:hypothetical protein [Chromobacterium violaceum]OQS45401.1 hypothetical protein B0T48_19420 [Chromobacterium violaceum]OQS47079.1 hypothetical protein B0T49_18505 [Chromobacterium violaceum]QRO32074.1 hypothetical protein I6K04_16470 [Chromobacterium violaceum]QRQ18125.1 hypothetical protein I6K03_06260 [Chromobacterium violaceum]
MANLQEQSVWETGIYQLETSDPVLAGPDGVDNLQGKQLANRTAYLKDRVEELASGKQPAGNAVKLSAARNIAMSGDGSWNVAFDGSKDVSGQLTLRDSGVAPGSYGMVTVDAKGRVTAARQMSGDDVPAHDWNKVATGKPTTLAGYGIADGASKTDLQNAVNGLVSGAPANLNTLQELAAAVNNDPKYSATVDGKLAGKADKATTLAGYGIADGASKSDLQNAVNGLVSGAPANLNTLQELAAAVNNDPKYSATVDGKLAGKADKATTLAGYGIADAASKTDLKTAVDGVMTLMPPNLIQNSHMTQLNENGVPIGFSVLGNGAAIKAVHPFTKGYEGPYIDQRPATASNSPADASETAPYWYGVHYMGPRSGRGGLADGWGGLTNGRIMKITAPNVPRAVGFRSVYLGAKFPVSTEVVYFSAWFYIVKGSIGLGVDAGYSGTVDSFNPGSTIIDKKMTDAAPDGWYRFSGLVGISRVTTLGQQQFCLGIGEGDFEAYMALPYLAVPFNQNFMVSC